MSRSRTAAMPLNANAIGMGPEPGPHVGMQSETIILETREFELQTDDPAPATLKHKFELKNRLRAKTTELAVFQEHYLMVRVKRKGKKVRSTLFNMRYLDTRPNLTRFKAKRALNASLGLFAGALLASLMAYLSVWFAFSTIVAASLAVAGSVALWLYADRTTETITFRTAEGQAPAFSLRANVGCRRACRALVPHLIRDIGDAKRSLTGDRHTYLRKAIREHYRLLEIGALSPEACSEGTRKILGEFDSLDRDTI